VKDRAQKSKAKLLSGSMEMVLELLKRAIELSLPVELDCQIETDANR